MVIGVIVVAVAIVVACVAWFLFGRQSPETAASHHDGWLQ